jgi:hypothetical protein
MEWTRIPTDLLQSRKSDKEIIAITKYQLLWAMLERQPDDETALRYMTTKQLQQARDYMVSIRQQVCVDIKTVTNKRKRDKIFYAKKQSLTENSDALTDVLTDALSDRLSASTDKIRLDKSILEKEKEKEIKNKINKMILKENQFYVDDNFSIKKIPEYEIYQKEVGDEILMKVQNWIIDKKQFQVVDKDFICKQIVNFSKRNGLI